MAQADGGFRAAVGVADARGAQREAGAEAEQGFVFAPAVAVELLAAFLVGTAVGGVGAEGAAGAFFTFIGGGAVGGALAVCAFGLGGRLKAGQADTEGLIERSVTFRACGACKNAVGAALERALALVTQPRAET